MARNWVKKRNSNMDNSLPSYNLNDYRRLND